MVRSLVLRYRTRNYGTSRPRKSTPRSWQRMILQVVPGHFPAGPGPRRRRCRFQSALHERPAITSSTICIWPVVMSHSAWKGYHTSPPDQYRNTARPLARRSRRHRDQSHTGRTSGRGHVHSHGGATPRMVLYHSACHTLFLTPPI